MKYFKQSHKEPSRLNSNKKGLSGPALIGTFILVFLMVFGLIALYQKVMKGGTKVIECKANGGDCVTGTCDFATQLPALSDKAAGCKSGELCCINITKSKPADPLCANRTAGKECNTNHLMFCDAALQCVTKCEFCSNNWYVEWGRSVCNPDVNKIFELNNNDGKSLSCNCTQAACTKKGNGECISNFCPRAAAETGAKDYACCTSS